MLFFGLAETALLLLDSLDLIDLIDTDLEGEALYSLRLESRSELRHSGSFSTLRGFKTPKFA